MRSVSWMQAEKEGGRRREGGDRGKPVEERRLAGFPCFGVVSEEEPGAGNGGGGGEDAEKREDRPERSRRSERLSGWMTVRLEEGRKTERRVGLRPASTHSLFIL